MEFEKLERTVEMLRYAVENNESHLTMCEEGGLEWKYTQKLLESCRAELSKNEKDLEAARKAGNDAPK